jgi:hypothetical protein
MIASSQERRKRSFASFTYARSQSNVRPWELFKAYDVVTAKQIGDLSGFQPRTNAALCKKWVEGGFLEIL